MSKVVIVIPVYKQSLTKMESVSFRQLIRILGRYEIVITAPEHLDLPKDVKKEDLRMENFDDSFFDSVDSYSCLLLSPSFYERFIRYQYLLIYQLDAFVFKDELEYFCSLGYDYIGAPWRSGVCEYANLKRHILYVGNGGFSLRKVEACINALRNNQDLLERYRKRNEDAFFSACDGRNFRVATKEVALSFAFEAEVRECFEENKKKLPFGCHAWERYDLGFWKPYIETFGYELMEENVNAGNEDFYNREKYLRMKRNVALVERDDLFYGIPDKLAELFQGTNTKGYFLWGAGTRGRWMKDLLQDSGVLIEGFIDIDEEKQGKKLDGFMIFDPNILDKESKIIVVVGTRYYSEVRAYLNNKNLGYFQQYIFWEDILPEMT